MCILLAVIVDDSLHPMLPYALMRCDTRIVVHGDIRPESARIVLVISIDTICSPSNFSALSILMYREAETMLHDFMHRLHVTFALGDRALL